eukprot:gene18804-13554_t
MGSSDRTIPQISERFIQVSCSAAHCCALDEKGYPHCWGRPREEVNPPTISWKDFKESQESFGWVDQAPVDEDDYADYDGETPIVSDDDLRLSKMQFRQISVTNDMSCGITLIGAHLRCWGSKRLHRRGRWPVSAKGPYRQVSAGGLGVCAIVGSADDLSGEEDYLQVEAPEQGRAPDSLECWGGASAVNPKYFEAWDQIAVGVTYACGVSMDSQLHCGGFVTASEEAFFNAVVMA